MEPRLAVEPMAEEGWFGWWRAEPFPAALSPAASGDPGPRAARTRGAEARVRRQRKMSCEPSSCDSSPHEETCNAATGRAGQTYSSTTSGLHRHSVLET